MDAAVLKRRIAALRTNRPTVARHSGSFLSTGTKQLDQFLKGGLPRGALCEVTGAATSGRTAWIVHLLAQTTRQGELAVYIDVFDSLDVAGLEAAGVDFDHLLWVRCRSQKLTQAVERAFKAADIVAKSSGFALAALDLHCSDSQTVPLPPKYAWFRLQRSVKGGPTVFLVLQPHPRAGSASALTLSFRRKRSLWESRGTESTGRTSFFKGIAVEIDLFSGGPLGRADFTVPFEPGSDDV